MATVTVSASPQIRKGAVTFKGSPMTLVGPELKAGSPAPEFTALATDLSSVALSSLKGRPVLISATPSLDTPVCDQQAKRFNEEAAKLPGVAVLNISMDLPFAQRRWCGAAGADRIKTLSDHRDASFGTAYGTLIQELRLLARAVFVVDGAGTVRYAEYVPEVTSHPNYDAALAVVRQIADTR
ncbi:MAG: lipid hydroperoxide peroxidase [Omnitrophica WOR_2 bacterium RIFCSPHIGHO2_02_FULL_68_15]|nr:MAG: lipid hydroperoxide peroxidase [Omnitrophica WOR_2 bacterium RIFCSPHIGHO2_02_FULL_68_15]